MNLKDEKFFLADSWFHCRDTLRIHERKNEAVQVYCSCTVNFISRAVTPSVVVPRNAIDEIREGIV